MSKSHSCRGKSQLQLTQHFSPQDKDASKTATSPAGVSTEQLTLDMLVGELEKLHKGITGELATCLNTALIPIQACLQKIADTVASHTATISGMETYLSAHLDGIITLEHEVATLKSKLYYRCGCIVPNPCHSGLCLQPQLGLSPLILYLDSHHLIFGGHLNLVVNPILNKSNPKNTTPS